MTDRWITKKESNGDVRHIPIKKKGVDEKRKEDLMLSRLGDFEGGSDNLYTMGCCSITEGVKYVMDNGYSWFVTDAMAVLQTVKKVKNEPFVVITLKPTKDGGAIVTYDDGNGNILYKQKYEFSDAKREVKLYYSGDMNLLLLPIEY